MRLFWKVYFFAALAYKLWTGVSAYSKGAGGFLAINIIYLAMFVAVFGLAFQKRIATLKLWRYGFALSVAFYLYEWIVNPLVLWHGAGIAFRSVAQLQAYSLPMLPLIVAVYQYAWRSDRLWTGGAPEQQESREPARWPRARVVFYLVAFLWLVLLPVFWANAEHFGWGFFPVIASIVVVPVMTLALVTDLVVSTLTAGPAPRPAAAARWIVPAVGAILLAGYGFALFVMLSHLR